MRHPLAPIALAAGLALAGGLATTASAAPAGPQCTSVRDCTPIPQKVQDKVEEIIETCQKAYCQFP